MSNMRVNEVISVEASHVSSQFMLPPGPATQGSSPMVADASVLSVEIDLKSSEDGGLPTSFQETEHDTPKRHVHDQPSNAEEDESGDEHIRRSARRKGRRAAVEESDDELSEAEKPSSVRGSARCMDKSAAVEEARSRASVLISNQSTLSTMWRHKVMHRHREEG